MYWFGWVVVDNCIGCDIVGDDCFGSDDGVMFDCDVG